MAKNADRSNPTKYPSLRKFCLMDMSIVEPLLVFCAHAIRMRDTRCCNIILRVFRSIIPEFVIAHRPRSSYGMPPVDAPGPVPGQAPGQARHEPHPPGERSQQHPDDVFLDCGPLPEDVIPPVREYISSSVLEACITSLHEPYFVDLQKELATLIANILVFYLPYTETPSKVLLSLPGITQADLARFRPYMDRPTHSLRQQRSLVLELLKDLKGVSISEQGKLTTSDRHNHGRRPGRSKMAQAFMTSHDQKGPRNGEMALAGQTADQDESLEGLANLFNG
jgi:exportin-5